MWIQDSANDLHRAITLPHLGKNKIAPLRRRNWHAESTILAGKGNLEPEQV